MINQLNFVKFNGCPRQAFLLERDVSESRRDRQMTTPRLRDVKRDMLKSFPYGVSVPPCTDVRRAAIDTENIIKHGEEVIFDAAFVYAQASTRCDVIMKNGDEYDIYAVTPTSRYTRKIDEVLYSKAVMTGAGFKTGNCYVCAIDREKTKGKALLLADVYNESRYKKAEERLEMLLRYTSATEPLEPKLKMHCGACRYLEKCFARDEESIFLLKSIQFNKKMSLYEKGIKTIEDYVKSDCRDERVMREIAVRNTDKDIYDREAIRGFLSMLKYPLGFLDFETTEVFNPKEKFLSPMDTVITQFSYHLIEKKGDEPKHFEFIGDGEHYCEREAAQKLTEYIKPNHTVLMYSDYERVCIERLVKRLPEFAAPLEAVVKNLVDLEKPFAKKYLVNRRMEGKSSLKKVLPALYPDEDGLDYKKMRIQNGLQAESVYARLTKMNAEERERAISDLKQYCALDTLAMIKLWEKLVFYGKMK